MSIFYKKRSYVIESTHIAPIGHRGDNSGIDSMLVDGVAIDEGCISAKNTYYEILGDKHISSTNYVIHTKEHGIVDVKFNQSWTTALIESIASSHEANAILYLIVVTSSTIFDNQTQTDSAQKTIRAMPLAFFIKMDFEKDFQVDENLNHIFTLQKLNEIRKLIDDKNASFYHILIWEGV